ncbi:MAG: permease [Sulfurimonadaceae bacterium]
MSNTKSKKPTNRSGWIMLLIVIVLYGVAAFVNSTDTYDALKNSFNILKVIAPILLVVVLLMAIINSFIQPKKIAKHLGKESGLKGWIIALLSGLFSHGSGYVWYPMLSDLRRHGVRDGLIVTFFYARAIKLPWLPMMISYFGLGFTIALTFYILLGALLQGVIADRLLSSKN